MLCMLRSFAVLGGRAGPRRALLLRPRHRGLRLRQLRLLLLQALRQLRRRLLRHALRVLGCRVGSPLRLR